MKKLKLSGVDIGALIAFVVITLAGVGGWWVLSGNLSEAQAAATDAQEKFKRYSADKKFNVVVSHKNGSTLQANIDTLRAQLGPLIQTTLISKDNKLGSIAKEDPVAWKHDLDDQVRSLGTAAKRNSVTVPQNFYFGFGRYQSQSPGDEQTAVLSKQLLGVEQIAGILINAPVKSIRAIRRTYEEDPHNSNPPPQSAGADPDYLGGFSYTASGNTYTAYPFEVEFETSPENLRPVVNSLIQSPYLFVLRSLSIHSSIENSPMMNSLESMAGPRPDPAAVTSPGELSQTPATKGPQYLFGNAVIQVKARIDLIEWTYQVTGTSTPAKK